MNKRTKSWLSPIIVVGVCLLLATSCSKDDDNNKKDPETSTVTDIDGNVYKTVTIGTQTWMAENLKTTKYRNGDPLSSDHENNYYDYDNDPSNGTIYGKLYSWYVVVDNRNIAPTGWHVPTNTDWNTLEDYVAVNLGASGSIAKALASTTNWVSSTEEGAIGNDLTKNNSTGFNALPGGSCGTKFRYIGTDGYWWSSSESYMGDACRFGLFFDNSSLNFNHVLTSVTYYSIRCVKD
jgi:uncharacterized protein (TIGR02145 family)